MQRPGGPVAGQDPERARVALHGLLELAAPRVTAGLGTVRWMWLAWDAYLLVVQRSPASDAGPSDEKGRSKAAPCCMRKLGPRYGGHDQRMFACKVIEIILIAACAAFRQEQSPQPGLGPGHRRMGPRRRAGRGAGTSRALAFGTAGMWSEGFDDAAPLPVRPDAQGPRRPPGKITERSSQPDDEHRAEQRPSRPVSDRMARNAIGTVGTKLVALFDHRARGCRILPSAKHAPTSGPSSRSRPSQAARATGCVPSRRARLTRARVEGRRHATVATTITAAMKPADPGRRAPRLEASGCVVQRPRNPGERERRPAGGRPGGAQRPNSELIVCCAAKRASPSSWRADLRAGGDL